MCHKTYASIAIPFALQTPTAMGIIVAKFAALDAFVSEIYCLLLGTHYCVCCRERNEESEDRETHDY
jgi:hypothetical protein